MTAEDKFSSGDMRCDVSIPLSCSVQSEREELDEMGYEWPDLQWALSVLHSRCFTMGSPALHLTVPGIDMANHTFTPNATVRWHPLTANPTCTAISLCRQPAAGPVKRRHTY